MQLYKGRLTREGSKASTRLYFETGLDKYAGLVDIAKEFELWPMESKQFVIDGKKVWPKAVENNPEKYFTPEILDRLNGFCQKKFLYGSDYVEEDTESTDT